MNRSVILSKHIEGNMYSHPHFFFINKGRDLGKPISFPQSDSYVCITRKADFEYLFWTCYYLWHSNGFKQVSENYMYSPIPLSKLNKITKAFQSHLHFTPQEWDRFLLKMRRIDRTEKIFRLNNDLAENGNKFVRAYYMKHE